MKKTIILFILMLQVVLGKVVVAQSGVQQNDSLDMKIVGMGSIPGGVFLNFWIFNPSGSQITAEVFWDDRGDLKFDKGSVPVYSGTDTFIQKSVEFHAKTPCRVYWFRTKVASATFTYISIAPYKTRRSGNSITTFTNENNVVGYQNGMYISGDVSLSPGSGANLYIGSGTIKNGDTTTYSKFIDTMVADSIYSVNEFVTVGEPGDSIFAYIYTLNGAAPVSFCNDTAIGTVFYTRNAAVGIDHPLDTHVSVYPNPFSSEINFNLPPELGEVNISLFDISGQMVLEKSGSNQIFLNTSNLIPGFYSYRVISSNSVVTGQIVRQ